MRTFPVDVPIASDPEAGLRSLREALSFYKAKKKKIILERFKRLAEEHKAQKATWKAMAEKQSKARPIDMEWLSYCVGKVRDGNTVLINEYDLRAHQVSIQEPGSFYGSPMSSGLGWCFRSGPGG